jgi:hypothetical protein
MFFFSSRRLCSSSHVRLEVFNSVILQNLAENRSLVYGILSAHRAFEDLGTFTLSKGLREIRRVQLAKEEQARKTEGDPKGKSPGGSNEEDESQDEKARLLGESDGALGPNESVEHLDRSPRRSEGQELPELDVPTTLPRTSRPSESLPTADSAPSSASEKARGKMKARRSLSLDTNSSLERVVASGIGRNGFVPTQEWVCFSVPFDVSFVFFLFIDYLQVTSWQQG